MSRTVSSHHVHIKDLKDIVKQAVNKVPKTKTNIGGKDLTYLNGNSLSPINLDEHSDLYFYKTDPNYQPLSPDLFCAENPDRLKKIHNENSILDTMW